MKAIGAIKMALAVIGFTVSIVRMLGADTGPAWLGLLISGYVFWDGLGDVIGGDGTA